MAKNMWTNIDGIGDESTICSCASQSWFITKSSDGWTRCLHDFYGNRVIVVVDNFDTPPFLHCFIPLHPYSSESCILALWKAIVIWRMLVFPERFLDFRQREHVPCIRDDLAPRLHRRRSLDLSRRQKPCLLAKMTVATMWVGSQVLIIQWTFIIGCRIIDNSNPIGSSSVTCTGFCYSGALP